jgi:hypothetical protein
MTVMLIGYFHPVNASPEFKLLVMFPEQFEQVSHFFPYTVQGVFYPFGGYIAIFQNHPGIMALDFCL